MGRMSAIGGTRGLGRALLVCTMLCLPAVASAQHAAFRVKGRVVTAQGVPIEKADVRLEAFYGYAAGTFAGP